MIQEAITTEVTPGTFEKLDRGAFEFMAAEGYALVRGYLTHDECDTVAHSYDEDAFLPNKQSKLFYEQDVYDGPTSTPVRLLTHKISRTMQDLVRGRKDRKRWQAREKPGAFSLREETLAYPDGASVNQHIDNPKGFPTQVLVTLEGEGTFHVFAKEFDKEPKVSLRIKKGDLLLFRGDDMPGRQLPHSVNDMKGDRLVYTLRPNDSYDSNGMDTQEIENLFNAPSEIGKDRGFRVARAARSVGQLVGRR